MPRLMKMGGKCCVILIALMVPVVRAQTKPAPATAPAFDEALKAAEGFKTAAGLKISVFAAEPQLENAVALCTDEKSRWWVVETWRFNGGGEGEGVYDIRNMMAHLDEDLACRTVDDRMQAIKRW